ncbi:MAG: YebC/PmpR family DNA-binding transcriptional regulator, partial [Ignavibacterium sp.]
AGADDLSTQDEFFEVQTSVESFEPVRRALVEKNFTIENASLQWIARSLIEVKGEDAEKAMKIIEVLEDIDDVQNVYSNADFIE